MAPLGDGVGVFEVILFITEAGDLRGGKVGEHRGTVLYTLIIYGFISVVTVAISAYKEGGLRQLDPGFLPWFSSCGGLSLQNADGVNPLLGAQFR